MNFKQLLIFFTLTILIISCGKSDDSIDEQPGFTIPSMWGEGAVDYNGEEITILFRANQNKPGGNVDICHQSYKRYLCFDNVPFQSGTYILFNREYPAMEDHSYAYYTNASGDAVGPEYALDETQPDNHFEITVVDENSLEIMGNFNLTFVLDSNYVSSDWPNEPDTIMLTNGSFHTKVL